jgi:hypothetical protein
MSQESRPKPYQPKGSVDGKICTSDLCNNMQFLARWGNACGTDFKKDEFCDKRRQWEYQRAYLEDRLTQPWVVCSEVNIKNKNPVMSKALKEYPFVSDAVTSNATNDVNSLPKLIDGPLPLPLPPLVPQQQPLPLPLPQTVQQTVRVPDDNVKNYNTIGNNVGNNFGNFGNNVDNSIGNDALLSIGGSFKPIQEFDNKKELNDFIKMFKKQNRKSYKSKNSSTRRNKKNNK